MKVKDLFQKNRSDVLVDGITFCVKNNFTCLILEDYDEDFGKEVARFVNHVVINEIPYLFIADYREGRWELQMMARSTNTVVYNIKGGSVPNMIQSYLDYREK